MFYRSMSTTVFQTLSTPVMQWDKANTTQNSKNFQVQLWRQSQYSDYKVAWKTLLCNGVWIPDADILVLAPKSIAHIKNMI